MNVFNIHPLLVHFPIALFVTYAALELVSFIKLFKKQVYWFYLKAVLVILGTLSAGPTILAGKFIEKQFPEKKLLIAMHSHINEAASVIFFLIAFAYLIKWFKNANINFSKLGILWKLSVFWQETVLQTPLVYFLAFTGLVLITLGGALGGAIVYGQNLDPFTNFIYSIFFH